MTPGPAQYNIPSHFDEQVKRPRFSTGMKTNYKANKGPDFPGPGEYEIGIPNNLVGNAHVSGTGQ